PAVELAPHRQNRASPPDEALLELPEAFGHGLPSEVVPARAELRRPGHDPPVERVARPERQGRGGAGAEEGQGPVPADGEERAGPGARGGGGGAPGGGASTGGAVARAGVAGRAGRCPGSASGRPLPRASRRTSRTHPRQRDGSRCPLVTRGGGCTATSDRGPPD